MVVAGSLLTTVVTNPQATTGSDLLRPFAVILEVVVLGVDGFGLT